MNIKRTLATVLFSATLISGVAQAKNTTSDMAGDMMNGHGMVAHEEMVNPAPAGATPRQELKDDMMYSGKKVESHGTPPVPPVAGADNHDDSGSLMHN